MVLNEIHDLQAVYRKLLFSMSRPGEISDVSHMITRMPELATSYRATFLQALVLLDGEVTFHVLPNKSSDFIKRVAEMTSAKYTTAEKADYIFVLEEANTDEMLEALSNCKIGNLINPQYSATWIIETNHIENGSGVVMNGPGIKDKKHLDVCFSKEMWQKRNERVIEPPLGIDLIFVSRNGALVCVPRTTKVEILGVKEWATLR